MLPGAVATLERPSVTIPCGNMMFVELRSAPPARKLTIAQLTIDAGSILADSTVAAGTVTLMGLGVTFVH